MSTNPSLSVVVCTNDRVHSLEQCLAALRGLEYPRLEVVVINGPSTDGTAALLESFGSVLKVGSCGEANISMARNLGVALAAGEIVAFIDDDAYPDPWWLASLVGAFADPEVAASGGPVLDYTGRRLQARFSTCDRHGNAEPRFESPDLTVALASPYSDRFAYPIGTNALFRRAHLVEIGGFDENYTYYMDETDVTRRLLDRGYAVVTLDHGHVYHKFLASSRRADDRVLRDRFTVMRSHTYFVARHLPDATIRDWRREGEAGAARQRADLRWHVEHGSLTKEDEQRFEHETAPAIEEAVAMALGGPRTRSVEWFEGSQPDYVAFDAQAPASGRRLHLCFLVEEYPPAPVDGIGRVVHALATGLAGLGHVVRVLCPSDRHDRVDLEDGVWVHRVRPADSAAPADVPRRIWALADAMRTELSWIERFAPIDVVQMPNWNSLGIAAIRDPVAPTVLALYTPLAIVADLDKRVGLGDPDLRMLLRLESECYASADFFLACGPDVVRSVQEHYDVELPVDRLELVPHGLADPYRETDWPLHDDKRRDSVDVLVVGRLEPRKGTDLMLDCAVAVLRQEPRLRVLFAGADRAAGDSVLSYEARFLRTHPDLIDRVLFLGRVSDEALDGLYRSGDVLAMPSRAESFGLTIIEAMAHGLPVLASDLGSSREILEHGECGMLLPVGATREWEDALLNFARSPALRADMGARGRQRFVEGYEQGVMVKAAERFYRRVATSTDRIASPLPG